MRQQNDNFKHSFRRRSRNDLKTNKNNSNENDDDVNDSSSKRSKSYQLRFNSTKNYFEKNFKKFRK